MTPKEKAKFLVNEKYYQPLTLHLNVNNNSKEMWEYAKKCALITVHTVQQSCLEMYNGIYSKDFPYFNETKWAKELEEIEQEIKNL